MRSSPRSLPPTLLLPLAIAALLAAGCGSDKNPTAPGGGGGGGGTADVVINIVANSGASSYSPNPDTVSVGQTVAWKNMDSMTHTATSDVGGVFSSGNIMAGGTCSPITMTAAGSYPYHCSLHPSMTGTLVVKP